MTCLVANDTAIFRTGSGIELPQIAVLSCARAESFQGHQSTAFSSSNALEIVAAGPVRPADKRRENQVEISKAATRQLMCWQQMMLHRHSVAVV